MTVDRDDLKMMRSPGRWPAWPFLPVKRTVDGEQECAVMVEESMSGTATPIVYLVNLFALKEAGSLSKVENRRYESLEAVVADGWVVD